MLLPAMPSSFCFGSGSQFAAYLLTRGITGLRYHNWAKLVQMQLKWRKNQSKMAVLSIQLLMKTINSGFICYRDAGKDRALMVSGKGEFCMRQGLTILHAFSNPPNRPARYPKKTCISFSSLHKREYLYALDQKTTLRSFAR